jgi:hypothetical protein
LIRARSVLAAALLALLCWIGGAHAYELFVGLAQDRCAFGPVSNARYLEWLAKAKMLRSREGDLINNRVVRVAPERGSFEHVTDRLFDELSRGVTSVEERIAIAHAMMRADGFLLFASDPDVADPYAAADSHVALRYGKFSLAGLLLLCQFDCKNRAYANLFLKDWNDGHAPGDRYRKNQFGFSYSAGPELESLVRYRVAAPRYPRTCPPMPAPEWAARLIAPQPVPQD